MQASVQNAKETDDEFATEFQRHFYEIFCLETIDSVEEQAKDYWRALVVFTITARKAGTTTSNLDLLSGAKSASEARTSDGEDRKIVEQMNDRSSWRISSCTSKAVSMLAIRDSQRCCNNACNVAPRKAGCSLIHALLTDCEASAEFTAANLNRAER